MTRMRTPAPADRPAGCAMNEAELLRLEARLRAYGIRWFYSTYAWTGRADIIAAIGFDAAIRRWPRPLLDRSVARSA